MVAINRGDNTRAFGGDFLRIYLNNPNNIYISKAVFHVNGHLEKVFDEPVFPLRVNFTGEETMLLKQDNTCQLALWDDSGRRRTADGKFTFFVRENRIKEPDSPDYYGEEYYDEEDNSVVFDLSESEFVAKFSINATPTKMSELQQDIPYITQDNIIGGRNIHTYNEGDNVIIEATLDTVQSYTDLTDKPSVNGVELIGNVEIACEQIQADYTEKDPESKSYIKNKPVLANVAYSGNYNQLSNLPEIPKKLSQLENDTKFITKDVQKLDNFYTKEETDELVNISVDLDPVYKAIADVETEIETTRNQLTESISIARTESTEEDNKLKNQINSVRDNLTNKLTEIDGKIETLKPVINEKVDIDVYNTGLGLKADLSYVEENLNKKVDLAAYNIDINKKANRSEIGKGSLTIRQNESTLGTFDANSVIDKTVDITVPTKLSELDNDAEFITKEDVKIDNFATKEYVDEKTTGLLTTEDLGHGILDIKLNGVSCGTFNANSKQNTDIELDVPTKLSELEQDISILTERDLIPINDNIDTLQKKIDADKENISDLYNELGNKVDNVPGKSLLLDSEIERLATLSNYDDTDVLSTVNQHTEEIGKLNTELEKKVDKEPGKSLSSNDFTNEYINTIEVLEEDSTEVKNNITTLLEDNTQNKTNIEELQKTTSILTSGLNSEVTARQGAIQTLQEQIDGMTAKSAVADIVATYADLADYPTSKLIVDDVICVLCDETMEDATTYYKWDGASFQYKGSEGKYYTKATSDAKYALKTTSINGHTLEGDVELTAGDLKALPDSTIIGDGTLTIQVEPQATKELVQIEEKGTFKANQTTNNAIRIPIPTKTSHIENDSQFVNQNTLDAVQETIGEQITGLEENVSDLSTQVKTITGVITGDVSGLAKVAFSNDYRDLDNKPTIPSAFSQLENDLGILYSSLNPDETTLEEVLSQYQLKEDVKTKLSEFENDRGYVTNNAIGRGILTVKINGLDFEDNTWMANEKDPKTIDIPVDNELSDTSTLPVQNNIVKGAIDTLDSLVVHLAGDEEITGAKTFTNNVTITGVTNIEEAHGVTCDIEDNSTNLATTAYVKNQDYCTNTDAVHKAGEETITGPKEFTAKVTLNEVTANTMILDDNSENVATTAFVKGQDYCTNTLAVHKTGDETIQGDKTFAESTTFVGITNLGKYAYVEDPVDEEPEGHPREKRLVNIGYLDTRLAEKDVVIGQLQDRINTHQTKLDEQQKTIESQQATITTHEDTLAELQRQLTEKDTQITALNEQIQQILSTIETLAEKTELDNYAKVEHTHSTADVTTLTEYVEGEDTSDLTPEDTLNVALSKLVNKTKTV